MHIYVHIYIYIYIYIYIHFSPAVGSWSSSRATRSRERAARSSTSARRSEPFSTARPVTAMNLCKWIYIFISISLYTCMYICIYVYTYIYIYIHICTYNIYTSNSARRSEPFSTARLATAKNLCK